MVYENVVIGESLGGKNGLGKPLMFLGRLKESGERISIWVQRRNIVLAIGKADTVEGFQIGEVEKDGEGWKWKWGIPIADIHGYEEFIAEMLEKEKEKNEQPTADKI